jgi:hypothetical protein
MLTLASRADAGVLTICCLEVATWARHAELLHTALAFAQAGTLASPEFAEAALHTGIAASSAGQDARAGTWLRRAVSLARREKDRAAYSAGSVELGTIYERRSDAERAEKFYRLAHRAGRRFKVPAERMRAAHGLFRLARPRDAGSAAQFALAAQRTYRPHSEGGPQLLLDLGRFWTEIGELGRARVVLRRLSTFRSALTPADQLSSWALTARTFAEKNATFSAGAASEAWCLMREDGMPEDVRFAAALALAHAARTAGDLVAFTRAKRETLRLAPPEAFPQVSREVAEMWPDGQPAPKLDRAS